MRDVLAEYAARATALRAREAAHARRSRWLSRARVAAFAAAVVALWFATRAGGDARGVLAAVTLLAIAAFVVLVLRHGRVKREQALLAELAALNESGAARVERRWEELTADRIAAAPPDHPYAIDLDLTGPGSLSRLLPPLSPALGQPMLRDWLLRPARPAEIVVRQAAVRELVEMRELRDLLAVHAARSGLDPGSVRAFERWASEPPWWSSKAALLWLTRVLPFLSVAALAASYTGAAPAALWVAPLAVSVSLTAAYRRQLRRELAAAAAPVGVFRAFREIVGEIARARFASERLHGLRATLSENDADAERAMRSLSRLADSAELRHSGLMYAVVQSLTLWDFHVLHALERWRERHGARVPGWFAALAELESLGALALLAHDAPSWTFPRVAPGERAVRATGLAHPLLPPHARVANDVMVGPPGTFLFVTGSNMSGKSTLVRAIGLNVVLAQAGAAVCAEQLTLPPLTLHTSMRVQDSLTRGVSLFMAEVERLRRIVDAAADAQSAGMLLYLLDEILHGTNSAERTIAARAVLRKLVELGAIGAVTSHDLQLTDAPALRDVAVAVHFREEVADDAPGMRFDYVLREGKATTRNALKLMAQMGLPVTEADSGSRIG